ncbi:MAG: twin transmembrane helix small protein [Acidiferrobacterales bacterium]
MRIIVIVMLIGIFVSLASAAVYLFRDRGESTRMAKALTIRIGLSIALFVLLMAGFYFGIISPRGI